VCVCVVHRCLNVGGVAVVRLNNGRFTVLLLCLSRVGLGARMFNYSLEKSRVVFQVISLPHSCSLQLYQSHS